MLKVEKRNGQIVDFDYTKIITALSLASQSANEEMGNFALNTIAMTIENQFIESGRTFPIHVETIQDNIEAQLHALGYTETLRTYILYRDKKQKQRNQPKVEKYKLLTNEFLKPYTKMAEPFKNTLSSFVYYRTYSRYLPEEQRREYWWETVARAVDFNCSLAPTTKQEAEELFDMMFNLKLTLSGRAMWASPLNKKISSGLSMFNCSSLVVNHLERICDTFYLLLVGAGVGFRVFQEDISSLPIMRRDVELISTSYEPLPQSKRQEYTTTEHMSKEMLKIKIGDSRHGWVEGLRIILDALHKVQYSTVKSIIVDYNSIRPYGEPILGFGGTASGHKPYQEMLDKITKIITNRKNETLSPLDILDIMNIIATCVVAGNVRRSSEICLFEQGDSDILNAKTHLYKIEEGEWVIDQDISHRQMSNNTIMYQEKPNREILHEHMLKMRYSGEPGFCNLEAMKKHHPDANLLNPCAEILILDDFGLCNLTTVNMLAFVNKDKTVDWEGLYHAQKLSARAGYRVTCIPLELPHWERQQKKHRSIGCSLSGVSDFIDVVGTHQGVLLSQILSELKKIAKTEADQYAQELGLNPPSLYTTIKPAGTSSLLYGESSGIHCSHSPYYIRRVRIGVDDPLLKVAEDMGLDIHNEVGQSEEHGNLKTKVVDFYVKSNSELTKNKTNAILQLELYQNIINNYTDHNCSITVNVRDHEWKEVEDYLDEHWDKIIAVSFLSHSNSYYQLMPYEQITKEQYEQNQHKMSKLFNPNLIAQYEYRPYDTSNDLDSDCESGVCAIR